MSGRAEWILAFAVAGVACLPFPADVCGRDADCAEGQFCDPAAGRCMPLANGNGGNGEPEPSCPEGQHDDGTGTCAPDGTCALDFELEPWSGRCYRWTVPASTLTPRRSAHRATRLTDGRVLVVGGRLERYASWEPETEVYSPIADRWLPHAQTVSDQGHSLVTLDGGDALLVGGYSGTFGTDAVYQPPMRWVSARQTFEDLDADPPGGAADLVLRDQHSAVRLADGRVLISGGYLEGAGALISPTALLYDPAADQWDPTGPLLTERIGHQSIGLDDGRVLVVGGWNNRTANQAVTSEIYDPVAGAFTDAGGPAFTDRARAARLSDGSILVVGGLGGDGAVSAAVHRFEPVSGGWTRLADLAVARHGHGVAALSGGLALVVGGQDEDFQALDVAELYDPFFEEAGGSVVLETGLSHGRIGMAVVPLAKNDVLVVAGAEMDGGELANVEAVDRFRIGW